MRSGQKRCRYQAQAQMSSTRAYLMGPGSTNDGLMCKVPYFSRSEHARTVEGRCYRCGRLSCKHRGVHTHTRDACITTDTRHPESDPLTLKMSHFSSAATGTVTITTITQSSISSSSSTLQCRRASSAIHCSLHRWRCIGGARISKKMPIAASFAASSSEKGCRDSGND